MSLDSFISALDKITPVRHGLVSRIALFPAEHRRDVLDLAAVHGTVLDPRDRYDVITHCPHHHNDMLRLTSPWPGRHAGLAIARTMLDWDTRLAAGETPATLADAFAGFEPDERYTGIADLAGAEGRDPRDTWARQSSGLRDASAWVTLVRGAIAGHAHDWLVDGEYGTDPGALDGVHETLACLLVDDIGDRPVRRLDGAVGGVLEKLHLVRVVAALAGGIAPELAVAPSPAAAAPATSSAPASRAATRAANRAGGLAGTQARWKAAEGPAR